MHLVKSSISSHQGVGMDIKSFVEEEKDNLDNVEGPFIDKLDINSKHVGLYPKNMNVKSAKNHHVSP